MASLLKTRTSKHATNAARPFSEFLRSQLEKAAQRTRRRTLGAPPCDPRLWLSRAEYAAWTLDGTLVVILDPEFRAGRGSPIVRRPTVGEMADLLAVNRLIPTVVALYPGDDLARAGQLGRYIPHHDLAKALHSALRRASDHERTSTAARATHRVDRATPPTSPGARRRRRSRFRPEGNFVLFRAAEDDHPPFAIELPLSGPPAFPDRRTALRFAQCLDGDWQCARVLAAVRAYPMWRRGIPRPADPDERLELLRQHPELVEPELRAEWLPRYVETADGSWRPSASKLRRTVRAGRRTAVLRRLDHACSEAVQVIRQHKLQSAVGAPTVALDRLKGPTHVLLEAQRRLPVSWQEDLGVNGLGQDWHDLSRRACRPPQDESGHWLRAPWEFTLPYDRTRRFRLIELRIKRLASLIEDHGSTMLFWMIKTQANSRPRWVMPT